MADTKIDWADKVWNPIAGCTKCSPGCLNCYAERMAIRLNGIFAAKGDNDNWAKMSNILKWDYSKPELYEFGKATGWNGEVELFVHRLDQPLHWRKPSRIFVCSMSDLFHEKVPFNFQSRVFNVMHGCPQHTFQVLTKRPDNMFEFFCGTSGVGLNQEPAKNIHLGVSISTQAEADEKIPILLQIPAAVRYLSIEPMLGPIDLRCLIVGPRRRCVYDCLRGCAASETGVIYDRVCGHVGWVIAGCESGPNRRPCNFEWIESIVEQCEDAGVPVFVKQIFINGKVVKMPEMFPQEYPSKK